MNRVARALALVSLAGCGAASFATPSPPSRGSDAPAEVARAAMPSETVAAALLERFALPFCQDDHCLDPYPLWAVTSMAVSHDRIALAGPGALVSLYADGAWSTLSAPTEGENPERISVHAVDFSPGGTSLVAVGSEGVVYDVSSEGLRVRARLPMHELLETSTLVDVHVVSADDVWVLQAEGTVFRLHGEEVLRRTLARPLQHLVSMGAPLEEALVVSGPFGGSVVRRVFSTEPPAEEPFVLGWQLDNLGIYSGCGPSMFDPRSAELEELAVELADQTGVDFDTALVEVERRAPPSDAMRAPSGAHVPNAGMHSEALLAALASTPAGRALLPIVENSPPWVSVTASRRRDDALATTSTYWDGHPAVWVRFGSRGRAFSVASLRPFGLERISVLDVRGDQAVMVDARGALVRIRAGEDAPTVRAPVPELADASAIFILGNDRAVVATQDRQLLEVNLADLSVIRSRALPGVVRFFDGDATNLYGVGDDGLAVHITEAGVVRLETGVTADLLTALVLGPRRLVVAGAAGTLLHLDESRPRALARITSEDIETLMVVGGVLHAQTSTGVTLREREGVLEARPSSLPSSSGNYGGVLVRFAPTETGEPFEARTSPLTVAIDEPEARAPFGSLRATYDSALDAFPQERAGWAPYFSGRELESTVFDYGSGDYGGGAYCCDPDYLPSDGAVLVQAISDSDCDECREAFFRTDMTHRLFSSAREIHVSVSRAAPSGTGCANWIVEAFRMRDGRSVGRQSIGCDGGEEAQRAALLAHLSTLEIDETWESAEVFGEELPEVTVGAGFYARSAGGRVEILAVDSTNRQETVLLRLPPGTPALAAPVPLEWRIPATDEYGSYTADIRFSMFIGPGVFWVGPTPGVMSGEGEAGEEDDEACTSWVVADADGHTTLRAGPSSRSTQVATLDNGTELTIARREGHWISVSSPRSGWLYDGNVSCDE